MPNYNNDTIDIDSWHKSQVHARCCHVLKAFVSKHVQYDFSHVRPGEMIRLTVYQKVIDNSICMHMPLCELCQTSKTKYIKYINPSNDKASGVYRLTLITYCIVI